jgi:anti-sigma regulatory factor (Ser/Thr protein kinase)
VDTLPQSLHLSSSLSELRRLTEFVDRFCQAADAPNEDRIALQVSLQEIATNVIVHGYRNAPDHSLVVSIKADNHAITATVMDKAPAFDPLTRPEIDTTLLTEGNRPIGGLGIHLVKKFGNPSYERRGNQNVLTLTRVRSSSSSSSSSKAEGSRL